jgi:gluconate 2-dehydrogenase gamma chain
VTVVHDRRTFLRAAVSAGASWAAASLIDVENALAFAGEQATAAVAAPASTLTAAQVEAVAALTSRILPSVDGRPGAREAGAVYFIDRALATFNASQRSLYVNGIDDLNRRAVTKGKATFAALAPGLQDQVIRDVENTRFFQAVRIDTLVGTFALPSWGGNREYMGWHLLGVEHQMTFRAPFGYYDGESISKG